MIDVQQNKQRCNNIRSTHILNLPSCCPVSANPQPGSVLEIRYTPKECYLEVESLRKYIDSYVNGRGDVRSMEGMIQQITKDCAEALDVRVECTANLYLEPDQKMVIDTDHEPDENTHND